MPQSYVSLSVHLIFSTRNREPLIATDLQPRLFDYLGGILRSHRCALLAIGGMPDHVHLLVGLDKQIAVSELVRVVKANFSKWVHETFPLLRGFAWQSGYGAFSVSASRQPEVVAYIERQAEHHRTMSFQEEFVAFLKRHEVGYEETRIWE